MQASQTKKKLYIRIGYPKTGATSTQVWMTRNTDNLAADGVLYPIAGRGKDHYQFGHHRLPWALEHTSASDLEISWSDMEAMLAEIVDSPATKVIISSENFCTIIKQKAIDLFASKLREFDVRIICYVRRQDDFIVSLWSTAVRHYGEKQPIMNYLAYPGLDYARILALWAKAFGITAILLRVFGELQLADDNAVADMLLTCGIDLAIGPVEARENLSLPSHISLILSYMNAQNAHTGSTYQLRSLGRLLPRKSARLALLSQEQRSTLLAQHAEANNSLARTYLGRRDGRLFNDLAIQHADAEPNMSTDKTECGLVPALGALVDDVLALVTDCQTRPVYDKMPRRRTIRTCPTLSVQCPTRPG